MGINNNNFVGFGTIYKGGSRTPSPNTMQRIKERPSSNNLAGSFVQIVRQKLDHTITTGPDELVRQSALHIESQDPPNTRLAQDMYDHMKSRAKDKPA